MSSPVGPSSREIRVLHVDDEPDFAELAAEFLNRQAAPLEITTVTSASEALDWLTANKVHCIVSDYDMPGQDGIEFLETARERYPDLPFILYTGKGSEELASEAISAGVTDYLQKGGGTSQYEVLANRIDNAVEQRRARREAVETEKRLQTIAEHTNDVLWKFSDDWSELRFINSAYEDIWGRPIDELRADPQTFLDGIHPDDREFVKQAMAQLSTGKSVDIEYRVNAEEEFGRWVWVEGEPVLDDEGRVTKVVGFARDITERKKRERELEQYRSFTRAATDVIVTIDANSTIRAINPAVADVFGYEPEELIGEAMTTLMPEALADRHLRAIDRYLETGERTLDWDYLELPGIRADGSEIPLAVSFNEVEYQEARFFTGVIRDITERKQRERELERQNERLEEFTSVVSHDLQNPLNVAVGRLELAQEEFESEHLDGIADAHDRMRALIDDLLRLAKEGDKVGPLDPVALGAMSQRCWMNVETGEASIATTTDRTIQADQSRLAQLLENVMRNAVEHGGGGVTVTVGDLPEGFYVEDDGPGIPADEREQVFEAGYSTTADGTGFGLAIVREIAEAHGWEIDLTEGSEGGVRHEITGVSFH